MFPHLPFSPTRPLQSSWSPEAPEPRKRREEPGAATSLSHPGDAEAGEAEEHYSDERDEQVHVPGPHGADSTAVRAAALPWKSSYCHHPPLGCGLPRTVPAPRGAPLRSLRGVARNLAPPTPTHPPTHTHPAPFPQQPFWPSILNRLARAADL